MNAPFDGLPGVSGETSAAPDHAAAAPTAPVAKTIAVVTAGTSDPSTTTMLANRVADAAAKLGANQGIDVTIRMVNLRLVAADITTALVSQQISPALEAVSNIMRDADAIIAATPVYKAGPSGLFTAFFQVLDNDLLIGTPVVLAATAGSPRHALVVDDQLRGLFSYLRTITVPTSIFAEPADWTSNDLGKRADRAATELLALITGGFREAVRGDAWGAYQHTYGSAGGTELGFSLDSDLMRLATGG